jgi:hypothetical protein
LKKHENYFALGGKMDDSLCINTEHRSLMRIVMKTRPRFIKRPEMFQSFRLLLCAAMLTATSAQAVTRAWDAQEPTATGAVP